MMNADRIGRVQERLLANGIAAYLVLTHDDYVYLLGEDRYQPRAIIPAQGKPIVVCFRGEGEEIAASLGVEEVRVFATVGQQIKDVVDAMRALFEAAFSASAPGKIRIGVQLGFGTPAFLLKLFEKANPRVEVVDIAPVMDELRAVKEPGELELMQRAAEIAARGMAEAERALAPGVLEIEVAAEAEYAMRRAGGYGTATPVFVNSGVRSCWLHGTATEKVVRRGDLVVVDLVPSFRGYCANLCRTFVVGEPSPEQRRLLSAYLRAQSAAVRKLEPGIRVREVDAAAKAVLDAEGLGEHFVPGISHGIGLAFEEWPMPTLHPTHQSAELRAGMTVTAGHSILAVPGIGGARFEDTFVVREEGPEPLTLYPAGSPR